MKLSFRHLILGGAAGFTALVLGCSSSNSGSSTMMMPYDVNMYPVTKLACDPMGNQTGGTPTEINGGLKADLYYLPAGSTPLPSVYDYYTQGTKSSQFFFFSQLDVPTRLFTEGFPLQTGDLVKDDTGQPLLENFALEFTTVLQLGPNDPEGDYEFALLADDGAVLSIRQSDGTYMKIVDDDGTHPTKMGCSATTVHMTKSSQLMMKIDYYQGPRYHIAIVPMWRFVSGARQAEPQCGQMGNSYFFDYANNSTPTANYQGLLNRGWKVIAPENYQIPASYYYNPCASGQAPKITNFNVVQTEGQVIATWQTDIPATTQVRYVDSALNIDSLTTSDNTLTTDHLQVVQLPQHGTYQVQAVSISADNGKALSGFTQVTY